MWVRTCYNCVFFCTHTLNLPITPIFRLDVQTVTWIIKLDGGQTLNTIQKKSNRLVIRVCSDTVINGKSFPFSVRQEGMDLGES